MVPTEGIHYLIEGIYKGETEDLKNRNKLHNLFLSILNKSKVSIFGFVDKDFNGDGVSGVFLLGESHFSYHSWPKEKYVSIDFYICGRYTIDNDFLNELYKHFVISDMLIVSRGIKTGKSFRIKKFSKF